MRHHPPADSKLLKGFSLSLCIKDIIEGKVNPDDVALIIANTYIDSEEAMWEVIKGYQTIYWKANPERAARLTQEFFAEGLIDQPRLRNEPHPYAGPYRFEPWAEWDYEKDVNNAAPIS